MGINFRENEEFLIIEIEDKLDSLNARETQDAIEERLKTEKKDIVFNFEHLEYISSAGLQILVFCAKNRSALSKNVYIYKPNDMIDNIIKVTGFYSFLKKMDSIE